ncbi:tRNA (adenosine(37)-N6)-threonylcarbamoyltransferase complex dimerization subunit type 1 TsaB [Pleurocapsales cyanobacterium LEGE 06147]|nr:tRNA (adenosine(37)-N6)-threonylcarbamoyltransferase complex dimerization subunit type 1 TsaB [Pleurocapsales cyanobacterium LEGE 06147]
MQILNPQKYALALHTTTPQLGIALSNFAGDSRTRVWDLGQDLSTHLHQYLTEMLQLQTWKDLAFIAVAKGPGGFTGTRIGVVTARTLAQQLDIPLFGISTLAAVACAQKEVNANDLLAVQMKARRGQLFVGIYQFSATEESWQTYLADTTMTPEAWQQTLASLDSPYKLIEASQNLANTVDNILELAYLKWQQQKYSQWSEVLPFYGQHPV